MIILKQYIYKCCADIVKHIFPFAQRGEWTRMVRIKSGSMGHGLPHRESNPTCISTLRFQFGRSIYLSIVASLPLFVLRRDNSCYGGQGSLWSWIYDVKPNKYISSIRFFMNRGSVYGKWISGPECLLAFAAWNQHPFQVICLNMLSHIPFV